jgi:hypothetical protein
MVFIKVEKHLTSWNVSKGGDDRLGSVGPVLSVCQVAEQDIQQDNKHCSQGVNEEEQLRAGGEALCELATSKTDAI